MKDLSWFAKWFDTEHYHMLYYKRDDKEAADFIRKTVTVLGLNTGAKVADIACGKGRHCRVLAGKGYHVFGYDLSENSINYARKHAAGTEEFTVHDMRKPYPHSGFDAAFNLFTSFGYFETEEEDTEAILNIFQMLKSGGYFVQDYINGLALCGDFPQSAKEFRPGLEFEIEKIWQPPYIIKKIKVNSHSGSENYMEKIKVYSADALCEIHARCGFKVNRVLGDYSMSDFDPESSPRIIIVSQKP